MKKLHIALDFNSSSSSAFSLYPGVIIEFIKRKKISMQQVHNCSAFKHITKQKHYNIHEEERNVLSRFGLQGTFYTQ
jgi:hypothetical protein